MGPRVGKSRETTQRDRARLLKRERTGGERKGEEKKVRERIIGREETDAAERRKDGKGGEKKKEGGRGSEWRKRENARGGSRERRKAKREGIWARNACRVINAPRYARSLWI